MLLKFETSHPHPDPTHRITSWDGLSRAVSSCRKNPGSLLQFAVLYSVRFAGYVVVKSALQKLSYCCVCKLKSVPAIFEESLLFLF